MLSWLISAVYNPANLSILLLKHSHVYKVYVKNKTNMQTETKALEKKLDSKFTEQAHS